MTRLPTDYKVQESTWSNYFKITEDAQEFRILASPIIGWEYFRVDGDRSFPVRQKEAFEDVPSDSKDWSKPKEFRAFPVWNHNLGKVQIMEITQASIKKEILKYVQDEENWWDPKTYDFSIYRTWKGKETRYTLMALPKSKFESEDDERWAFLQADPINLEALFDWGDPFKPF